MQQCRRLERFPPRRLKREVGTGVIEHAELGCGDPTKAIVIFTSHCGDQRKPSCAGDILIHTNQRQIEFGIAVTATRSEEHTSELQSLMRISYAVFCLKKKTNSTKTI